MSPGRDGGRDGRDEEEEEDSNWLSVLMKQAGPYMAATWTLTGGLLGLGLIGWYLDGRFGTDPLLLLIGLGIGLVVGFWELAKVVFSSRQGQ